MIEEANRRAHPHTHRLRAFSSACLFAFYVIIPGGIAFTALAEGVQGPAGVVLSVPLGLLLGLAWYESCIRLHGVRLTAVQLGLFAMATALMALALFRVLSPREWLVVYLLTPILAFIALRKLQPRRGGKDA